MAHIESYSQPKRPSANASVIQREVSAIGSYINLHRIRTKTSESKSPQTSKFFSFVIDNLSEPV